jgi:glycosyltransferase involved in cell wall biosynthesis
MKTAAQPLVSIVTPVHNEAKYLAECIEGVLAQTYKNWDYTIVDNCSDDGSVEIARRYAAKDRRIQIRQTQQLLSAIANHNFALRQICPASKYCKIVFGDDWVFPECLERMVTVAERHPSVGIVSAYALEGQQVNWTGLPYPATLISGREICRKHFLEGVYVFGTPTTVLYRADLVRSHDPFYNEGNIHADTEVCFALLKSWDFAFVHQVLSFTRARQESLSRIAADINAHFGAMLHLLATYGTHYLSHEELEDRLDSHLSEYYSFLGKSLLLGRDKKFWEYHKQQLNQAGVGFSRFRLAKGAITTLCGAALSPKDSIKKLLKRRDNLNATEAVQCHEMKPLAPASFKGIQTPPNAW